MPHDRPYVTAPDAMDVRTAQREIARILAELEQATNTLVLAVQIDQVDSGAPGDDPPHIIRRVHLVMGATPGFNWQG